jgi:hypothetical protein
MELISDTTRRILEIEARQDDALRELEALERRLEQVLAEYLPLQSGFQTLPANNRGEAA